MKLRSVYWLSILQFTLTYAIAGEFPAPARDGSHDFDFLIGNWKAYVRRLPDRLVGSNNWIQYQSASPIIRSSSIATPILKKFDVDNPEKHLHINAQTLRLYKS